MKKKQKEYSEEEEEEETEGRGHVEKRQRNGAIPRDSCSAMCAPIYTQCVCVVVTYNVSVIGRRRIRRV